MKKLLSSIVIGIVFFFASCAQQKQEVPEETKMPKYQPNWKSLANHNEAPEWFQNAKFGIYFHWGVYSVPAYDNEWYPRFMHFEGSDAYNHHVEKYGHPSEFGYHDFVPLFTAEKFDAKKWAGLFHKAGAKFAGPVAEHHDGFSMWDSEVTPWNAADKGPKKDITGLLAKEIKAKGMKLITTFHHARNLQRKDSAFIKPNKVDPESPYWNSHYPFFEGMPPTSDDSELKYLYGNIPEDEWVENVWLAKVDEVTKKYQPDIIWFDVWLDQIPENFIEQMVANYLNKADEWGKEVVLVSKHHDLPPSVSVDDLEKSRKNELGKIPWMTDETLTSGRSWCYTEGLVVKPVEDMLHVLIDIVSKNGVLLLNISPKANGEIPQDQQETLLAMGAWLDKYGEAIYETKPWYTYGEGPTKEPEGHFDNHKEFEKIKYSWKDIRFTTRDEVIYATFLGWPEEAEVTIQSFSKKQWNGEVTEVTLMGSEDEVKWEMIEKGLKLTFPSSATSEIAPVLKISTK